MKMSPAGSKRVLVVDDDPLMLKAVDAMLQPEGYRVETADDGDKAMAKFKPGKYSLIITDFLMPVMDGLELAKAVKALSPAQPILLITGFAGRIADEGRSCADVDLLLGKPFTSEEFQEAVARVLAGGENPRG